MDHPHIATGRGVDGAKPVPACGVNRPAARPEMGPRPDTKVVAVLDIKDYTSMISAEPGSGWNKTNRTLDGERLLCNHGITGDKSNQVIPHGQGRKVHGNFDRNRRPPYGVVLNRVLPVLGARTMG